MDRLHFERYKWAIEGFSEPPFGEELSEIDRRMDARVLTGNLEGLDEFDSFDVSISYLAYRTRLEERVAHLGLVCVGQEYMPNGHRRRLTLVETGFIVDVN